MSFSNKLVITAKRPKKRTKLLCKHIRRMLEPNVTAKLKDTNTTVESYLDVADMLELSHFVLIDSRDIKIGVRPAGPTYVFNIVDYNPRFVGVGHDHYKTDPYITFSGSSEFKDVFLSLTSQPTDFKRNLHFHSEDGLIHVRHYAVVTKEEDDIKVGLHEIGPRISMRFVKEMKGFFR